MVRFGVTVSVVGHGHGELLNRCLESLASCPSWVKVVLTLNVPDALLRIPEALVGRLQRIDNLQPRGFGENHNTAFFCCDTPYFCVLNPDVVFKENPFGLLQTAMSDYDASLAAPFVSSPQGLQEDSWRSFPTPGGILSKLLFGAKGKYPVVCDSPVFSPDWVGGMFMLFRSDDYRILRGFDEKFFLYYEDVDICTRLWKRGLRLIACPGVAIIHDAQRDSHRNFRHFRWHLSSMVRYFSKHWGRMPRRPGGFQ